MHVHTNTSNTSNTYKILIKLSPRNIKSRLKLFQHLTLQNFPQQSANRESQGHCISEILPNFGQDWF